MRGISIVHVACVSVSLHADLWQQHGIIVHVVFLVFESHFTQTCDNSMVSLFMLIVFQSHFTQTCGNSIVERGEECDCGSEEVKKTPTFHLHSSFVVYICWLIQGLPEQWHRQMSRETLTCQIATNFLYRVAPLERKPEIVSWWSWHLQWNLLSVPW